MTHHRQHGFTLIETLAALALAVILAMGVSQLVLGAVEDNKAQQTGQHQQRVAAAATKYLEANHGTLLTTATATSPVPVTVAQLQAAGFLSNAVEPANPYGQTPCLLVLQPTAGRLEALLVSEGDGTSAIPEKMLPFVASNAGAGGGYISYGSPAVGQGVFGSWKLPASELSNYLSANCTGKTAASGSLATALFYEASETNDFVYRNSVPGRPELNRMTTPLHMAAVAVPDDTTDARCVAADATTHGRIAVDATGRVLSCQAGTWKRQGSASWKDPVATHADLPTTPTDNSPGDVRMVSSLSRAFTWNGTAWVALAVDESGNLAVPGTAAAGMVQLNTTVVKGDACPNNGLMARDGSGNLLVCTSGLWRSLREDRVTSTAFYQRYFFTPPDGIQNFVAVDLTTLPGPRPLYITGYSYCNSSSGVRAWTVVESFDAAGNRLGYSGGCGARSSDTLGVVMTKGVVPLAKLPENAARIRVYMEPGALAGDYAQLDLYVKNSE